MKSIYIYLFTFIHLVDDFIQSNLQLRERLTFCQFVIIKYSLHLLAQYSNGILYKKCYKKSLYNTDS